MSVEMVQVLSQDPKFKNKTLGCWVDWTFTLFHAPHLCCLLVTLDIDWCIHLWLPGLNTVKECVKHQHAEGRWYLVANDVAYLHMYRFSCGTFQRFCNCCYQGRKSTHTSFIYSRPSGKKHLVFIYNHVLTLIMSYRSFHFQQHCFVALKGSGWAVRPGRASAQGLVCALVTQVWICLTFICLSQHGLNKDKRPEKVT